MFSVLFDKCCVRRNCSFHSEARHTRYRKIDTEKGNYKRYVYYNLKLEQILQSALKIFELESIPGIRDALRLCLGSGEYDVGKLA